MSVSDADLAQGFVNTATSTTTITLDAGAVATEDYYNGERIVFTHGAGAGQSREVKDYTSGRVLTMDPALITAVGTDTVWHIMTAVDVDHLVEDVLAGIVEGTTTLAQATAVILAATAGVSSGGGTSNIKFRDVADSKDRIDATVDSSGNRTATTIDGS